MKKMQQLIAMLIMQKKLVEEVFLVNQNNSSVISDDPSSNQRGQIPTRDLLGELKKELTMEGLSQRMGVWRQTISHWQKSPKKYKGKGARPVGDYHFPAKSWMPKIAILHSELFGSDPIENVRYLYAFHTQDLEPCPNKEAIEKLIERTALEHPWGERLAVGQFRRAYQEATKETRLSNKHLIELASFLAS